MIPPYSLFFPRCLLLQGNVSSHIQHDGNNNIQSVGFSICQSVSKSYWEVFHHVIQMAWQMQEMLVELVVSNGQNMYIVSVVAILS